MRVGFFHGKMSPGLSLMKEAYVFLDIDGTLVDGSGQLPASAARAMQTARQNGHRMILATGRQRSQIYSWLTEQISFDGIIAASGAYIEDQNGRILFESRPEPDKLRFAVDFFREHNTPYCLQCADAVVTERWCTDPIADMFRKRGFGSSVFESLFGRVVYMEDPGLCSVAEKIAYYNSPLTMEEMQAGLGDYFSVMGYSLSNGVTEDHFGEITFGGISKATGIQFFMKAMGAEDHPTVAVGDSGNDIDMVRFADVGVAMGNATADLKAAADLVTASLHEDGIEKAFQTLGLLT